MLGLSLLETGVVPIQSTPVSNTWDGAPYTLNPGESIEMPSAPCGSAILTAENLAIMNNAGQVIVHWCDVTTLDLQPNIYAPVFMVKNWMACTLNVLNCSPQPKTPIKVQLIGAGLGGTDPKEISLSDVNPLMLSSGESAIAVLRPRMYQFLVNAPSGDRSTVVLIGGPPDPDGNNAKVYGVNFEANTEFNTQYPPPAGYYKTTTSNTITVALSWPDGGQLFCANLSSDYADPVELFVRQI